MAQVELRYRGDLLGFHPSKEAAEQHARLHHGLGVRDKEDHHVEDEDELSIEPRRPVTLFCRGSIVDTFDTDSEATGARDDLVKESRGSRRPLTDGDFAIVHGASPPPIEPPPEPEPEE